MKWALAFATARVSGKKHECLEVPYPDHQESYATQKLLHQQCRYPLLSHRWAGAYHPARGHPRAVDLQRHVSRRLQTPQSLPTYFCRGGVCPSVYALLCRVAQQGGFCHGDVSAVFADPCRRLGRGKPLP